MPSPRPTPDQPIATPPAPDPRSDEHRRLLEAGETLMGGSMGLYYLPNSVAFVAAEGRGSRLYDVDGRELIDFMMGYGPLILGHAHPSVVEAVQRRAARGSHFYLLSREAVELAAAVAEAVPGAERVRFVGTGSEATLGAMRLARTFTGRSKVLVFDGAFHGTHDYAITSYGGVPPAVRGEVLKAPFNDLERAAELVAGHAGELAAVIVEPIQRCVPPQPGFLQGLRALTREHDVLLIFDDVVTGFRLAYGGAQAYYGVQADLTCLGKILGGGYPLAAVAGRADVIALCDVRRAGKSDYTPVSGTLSGNPLAAAAGLATLAELRRAGVYERLHALGDRLRHGLEEIGRRRGVPLRAAGHASVFAPIFSDFEPLDAAAVGKQDYRLAQRFGARMIRRGVLLDRRAFISTAHTASDIARALEVADEVMKQL
jgi:glutamate-1-semialdehyde 2,1-aminomutase